MESRSTKVVNSNLKRKENPTFSFLIAMWLLVSLPFGVLSYYFALHIIPIQNPYYSFSAILFLRFLLVLNSQGFAFPLLISLLPFSPIDFSFKALKKSFFHTLTFICTFPILLLEFYFLEIIIEKIPSFRQSDGVLSAIIVISIFPIMFWMLLTSWIWEVLNGKNSSHVLKMFRERLTNENQDLYQEILDFQYRSISPQLIYPLRWGVISVVFPFLIWSSNIFFENRFIKDSVFIFSWDLFLFVWQVPIYLHIFVEKGCECKTLRAIYLKLFGEFDISKNIGLFGTLFVLVFPLIYAWYFKVDEFIGDLSFFLIYSCMVLIFLGIIFSNQIKQALGLNIQTTKEDDDEYKPLFK